MNERVLRSPLLSREGVSHGFSLRTGGVSHGPFMSLNLGKAVGDDPADVDENLRRFCADVGVERASLATVSQVHGNRVVVARSAGWFDLSGKPLSGAIEADAVIALEGRTAGVRVADCVPILVQDVETGVAAAIHAGWRGTIARIVPLTLEAMQQQFGSRTESLRTAVGPSIGPCCFEVGEEVAQRFASEPGFGPSLVDRTRATPHVDLVAANAGLMRSAGISPRHIDVVAPCTVCAWGRFFSHRRDAGRTGRHLALVRSRPAAGS